MSGPRGAPDPYRELGVPRGATEEQVKAAHRRLAKRFHPDGADGDQVRFLAVQEAYLLLSDPIRRRDWDTRHAPGPVRASERPPAPRPSTARPPTPPASAGAPPARPENPYAGPRPTAGPRATAGPHPNSGPPGNRPPGTAPNDRDPASRSTTWSARGVPWWEDFRADGVTRGGGPPTGAGGPPRPPFGPGSRQPGGGPSGSGSAPGQPPGYSQGPGTPGTPGAAGTPGQGPGAGDIFAKSSGAAWSSAARRHFRKDEADLPRGGSFRYRGTQVVTGAESRQDAEARQGSQPPPSASPTQPPSAGPTDPAGLMSRLRKRLGGS